MKLKDLNGGKSLGGVKVKTSDGRVGYWTSQWSKGVWLSPNKEGQGKVYHIFVSDLREVLEWDVVGDETDVNLYHKA